MSFLLHALSCQLMTNRLSVGGENGDSRILTDEIANDAEDCRSGAGEQGEPLPESGEGCEGWCDFAGAQKGLPSSATR